MVVVVEVMVGRWLYQCSNENVQRSTFRVGVRIRCVLVRRFVIGCSDREGEWIPFPPVYQNS